MEGQGEDKAQEFKKQKMQKNNDGQSYANWQTSSVMSPSCDLDIFILATLEF